MVLHFCILWNFVRRLERSSIKDDNLLHAIQLLNLYHNNIVDLFVIDTSWKKYSTIYHDKTQHCFYLHNSFLYIPLKRIFYRLINANTLNLCNDGIFYLLKSSCFMKGEEILTHHISNSMLNLIHERNTQQLDKHNSFTLLQIKTERNGTTWEYGNIFLVSWMRLLWFCMVNYYCL